MSTQTPALDFLRKVQVWQEDEGKRTAGLVVVMPPREDETLAGLLRTFDSVGATRGLEDRARMWLVGYRELEDAQRVLTEDQRAELHDVTDRIMSDYRQSQYRHRPQPAPWWPPRKPWLIAVIAVVCLLIGIGTAGLVKALAGSANGAPPPAGPVAQAPQHPAQGPLTDLQQFKADWNVPAAATADAGNPRQVVLLDNQSQLYYPTPWAVPVTDPAWQDNLDDGPIRTATVHGNQADVTDSNGTTRTVAVEQPFVLASSPGLVLRVLQNGTVQSMPGSHAIVIRYRR